MTDWELQRRLEQAAKRKAKAEAGTVSARDSLTGYVREARARGWSLRRIAEAANMSAQNVSLLVGKSK